MHTCREPDYVAHGKKEVGEVEKYDALLRVEEPDTEKCRQEDKQELVQEGSMRRLKEDGKEGKTGETEQRLNRMKEEWKG